MKACDVSFRTISCAEKIVLEKFSISMHILKFIEDCKDDFFESWKRVTLVGYTAHPAKRGGDRFRGRWIWQELICFELNLHITFSIVFSIYFFCNFTYFVWFIYIFQTSASEFFKFANLLICLNVTLQKMSNVHDDSTFTFRIVLYIPIYSFSSAKVIWIVPRNRFLKMTKNTHNLFKTTHKPTFTNEWTTEMHFVRQRPSIYENCMTKIVRSFGLKWSSVWVCSLWIITSYMLYEIEI